MSLAQHMQTHRRYAIRVRVSQSKSGIFRETRTGRTCFGVTWDRPLRGKEQSSRFFCPTQISLLARLFSIPSLEADWWQRAHESARHISELKFSCQQTKTQVARLKSLPRQLMTTTKIQPHVQNYIQRNMSKQMYAILFKLVTLYSNTQSIYLKRNAFTVITVISS